MPYVYVLRSLTTGQRYVGSTDHTPQERLNEHHRGMAEWTKRHRPFELIYSEEFANIDLARKREKFFKTGKGRKVLESLLIDRAHLFPRHYGVGAPAKDVVAG